MNHKNKLHGVTSFLAICASVVSACVCILLLSGDYHSAQLKLDTYERELQGWQACRQTNPDYFKTNEQAVNSCLANIDQARDNFWVKLPKAQLAGLLIFAGLVSASVGYLITWAVVWLIGFSIYKATRLLTFPFRYNTKRHRCNTKRQVQNKNNIQSLATKREKIPLVNRKGNANPVTKPVGTEARKPDPSEQPTSSNSLEQALSNIERAETIISDRTEKQEIFQKT